MKRATTKWAVAGALFILLAALGTFLLIEHSSPWLSIKFGGREYSILGKPLPTQDWRSKVLAKHPTFKYLDDLRDGLASFQTADQKWGWVNSDGDVIVPAQFDLVGLFKDGRSCTLVFQGGGMGLINRDGRIVVAPDPNISSIVASDGHHYCVTYDDAHTVTVDESGATLKSPEARAR